MKQQARGTEARAISQASSFAFETRVHQSCRRSPMAWPQTCCAAEDDLDLGLDSLAFTSRVGLYKSVLLCLEFQRDSVTI